ncbi:putative pectinesterase 52 [Quercus suber]|uniref:pectinesterase n=1 Tax=Quercus suber TaxID=58331 RepID=A0AAW0L332_QUESU
MSAAKMFTAKSRYGGDTNIVSTCTVEVPLVPISNLSALVVKNTFNHVIRRSLFRNNVTWAPAAFVQGDKVSFHSCDFISLQDTLTDWEGRHYFDKCYFEGAIDFIWGAGQSIYQTFYNSQLSKTRFRSSSTSLAIADPHTIANPRTIAIPLSEIDLQKTPATCQAPSRRRQSCIKVSLNIVSPENVGVCICLMEELHTLPQNHRAKVGKLEEDSFYFCKHYSTLNVIPRAIKLSAYNLKVELSKELPKSPHWITVCEGLSPSRIIYVLQDRMLQLEWT